VANRVLAEAQAVNAAFPQINVVPVTNQGNFIERAIANVSRSILYGGSLAILVLLWFLRDIRSTAVIALAIPISVVATFALMYVSGFTLNLMTLGGLALGVGMMVDSSVVVLENIYRNRQESKLEPVDAAVIGAQEVTPAVIAGTVTTLVIFLPLIFVRGVSGVLFKELAYIIMFALGCSLVVALSLVPVLSSRMKISAHTKDTAAVDGTILGKVYRKILDMVLNARVLTIGMTGLIFVVCLKLVPHIGTEFLPPSDEGEVIVTGEMEVGTRLDLIDRQTRKMEEIVFDLVPEAVSSVVSVTASGIFGRSAARGEIRLSLTPATDRNRSNSEIAAALRKSLDAKVAGMKIRVRAPQGQFLLERILRSTEGVTVEVRGFDFEILEALAKKVAESIGPIEGVTDVELSQEAGIPQQEILVDRVKAADLGLSVRDITRVIETAVAGSNAGEYRVEGNSYRILLQLRDAEKRSLDEILDLSVRTADGSLVVLRNVVNTRSGRGPVTIERKDQQRIVTVTANVAGRDLGSVATDIQLALGGIARPLGYDTIVSGSYAEQQESFNEIVFSLVLALLLVYMVLASQYESFIDPLIVMFAVPFAATGVILTLFITDTTLNLQSAIGCIMLGGIVVNNAILLVDQAGHLRNEGMSTDDALTEAGRRRLRPVLMTTLTTILALLPLALGIGEGADAQAPMARTVIGGLTISTLITLVLIPAIYSLVHGLKPGNPVEDFGHS
jgi:HAE1 family hydrophobic/amphiphilic exporter-1